MKRLLPVFIAALILTGLAAGCEAPTAEAPGEAATPMSTELKGALTVLPADAKFAAAADVQALRNNGFLGGNEGPKHHLDSEWGARLRDFFDATGFNPREEIQNVYLAKPSGPKATPQMVVVADFDRARFQKQLEGERGSLFETETYRGRTLYRSTRDNHDFRFALTGEGLILLAPRAEGVHAMIDRLEGDGSPLDGNSETMRLVEKVRGGETAWFVARDFGPSLGLGKKKNAQGRRLNRLGKTLRGAAGTFTLSDQTVNGQLLLYAQDGANPADLEEVIEGLVAAAKSQDSLSETKRRAVESVEIARNDDEVRVSFSFANEK